MRLTDSPAAAGGGGSTLNVFVSVSNQSRNQRKWMFLMCICRQLTTRTDISLIQLPRELCTRGLRGIRRATLTHESHTCHALSWVTRVLSWNDMSHNCHVMLCYESHVSCSHAVAWARDESAGVVVQYTVYRPQPALARPCTLWGALVAASTQETPVSGSLCWPSGPWYCDSVIVTIIICSVKCGGRGGEGLP